MSDQGSSSCSYRFICSSLTQLPASREYDVIIRQQPERSKMSVINERDRRPIEPPPILQMQWLHCSPEDTKKCLQSPFYFLVANLVDAENNDQLLLPAHDYLSGTTVSSLHRLRDIDNQDGGFFVFGDLSVKKNGVFKLQFSLFEIVEESVQNRKTLLSDPFVVYVPKKYPGPLEATFLSRTFSDQGVKMRIRKEHRLQNTATATNIRKRKADQQERSDSNASEHSISSIITKTSPSLATERASKRKIVPPAYAPSSSQDVHFGRFLSSERPSPQPSAATTTATVTTYDANDYYHIYPYHRPLDGNNPALPSTIIRSAESAPNQQQQHHHQAMIYPSPQSSTDHLPCTTTTTTLSSSSTSSSHNGRLSPPSSSVSSIPPSPPTYAYYYSSSPPTLSMDHHHHQQKQQQQHHSLPITTHSLASYHLSSSPYHHHSKSPPLDTVTTFSSTSSPPPMPDHSWGSKLPPLRAIMTQDYTTATSDPISIPPARSFWQLPPIQYHSLSTPSTLPIYP